jgi:SAM-dependent methyltransferase
LRLPEVTRALRALSSAYVHRRQAVASGATFDGAGKRAAFALFYAPIHFLATEQVVRALDAAAAAPAPTLVLDIGCGTGAAGAAWALAARDARSAAVEGRGSPASPQADAVPVQGIDRHSWAVSEATWTYREFGLVGRARVGDVARLPAWRPGTAVIAANVLNELGGQTREALTQYLLDAVVRDPHASVLVIEPIARSITPWWSQTAERVVAAGGRADEWTLSLDLPPLVALLDKAAGLNHRQIKARSLFLRGS